MNERRLKPGTSEHIDFLDEMITNLQDVKRTLGVRRKEGKALRKEASKLQDAISSLRYLREKSNKLLLNGPEELREEFSYDDIRNFFHNLRK